MPPPPSRSTSHEDATASGNLVKVEHLLPTKPLLHDLHLWRLTRSLQRLFIHLGDGPMQPTRARDQTEARNILDRWLLSFQLDYSGGMDPNMPMFPVKQNIADGVNQKLVDECLEKRFSVTRRNAERITQCLIDAVGDFPAEVERRLCEDDGASAMVSFWERRISGKLAEGQLRIGDHYNSPCCPRLWFLTKNFGLYNTARMMLRYETLGTGSLQWGDPVTVHHALYDLMGVRYEGFASPLNSKMLGKKGAAFCSLFRDTDAPYGSLGEFFSVDFDQHPGGWTINPPFIEELMGRVADKVLDYLDRQTGTCWFFVTFPKWDDCPGWQKLSVSTHKRQQLDMSPREFTVQDCYGRVFSPKNTLTIFAMGQLPGDWTQSYQAIKECFLCVDIDSVEDAWRKHCLTAVGRK